MTEDEAATVLKTASGKGTGHVKAVKASKGGRYGATHAATETGDKRAARSHTRRRRSPK